MTYLLEGIINKGDIIDNDVSNHSVVEFGAQEIAPLLRPLALFVSTKTISKSKNPDEDEELSTLGREAWFNIAVHGITLHSKLGQRHAHELRVLAMHSEPLVAEDRAEQLESDMELNTILRRGMNAQNTADQKRHLISVLPNLEPDIRRLSYPKVIFLNATYLVETLRAASGNCAKVLTYFPDPSLKNSEMGSCMSSIVDEVVKIYLNKTLSGQDQQFLAPYVAKQLAEIFAGCCHRIEMVQGVAITSASRIIAQTPSALCQKSSLFALLELLTIMWSSCLEEEIDEYEWRSVFTSTRGKISVELSDNYAFRKYTLNSFYKKAKEWVTLVMSIAPLDVKGLLQVCSR